MKKLYLFLAFALSASFVKAQTLDETVDWLSEKLQANMDGYYFSKGGPLYYRYTPVDFGLDECQLIFKIRAESSFSGGGSWDYHLIIPLQEMVVRSDGTFSNFGIQQVTIGTTYRDRSCIGNETVLTNSNGLVKINLEKERDILERMRKAFKHLATFCPPKKGETF